MILINSRLQFTCEHEYKGSHNRTEMECIICIQVEEKYELEYCPPNHDSSFLLGERRGDGHQKGLGQGVKETSTLSEMVYILKTFRNKPFCPLCLWDMFRIFPDIQGPS